MMKHFPDRGLRNLERSRELVLRTAASHGELQSINFGENNLSHYPPNNNLDCHPSIPFSVFSCKNFSCNVLR